jgi:hypothetical protein
MEREEGVGQQLVILVSLVVTGVALSSLAALPSWQAEFVVLGSPLSLGLTGRWILALAMVAVTAVGMADIVRFEVGGRMLDLRFMSTFWILPCLVTLAAVAAVPGQTGDVAGWLGTLVLIGVLLACVLAAEFGTVDLTGPYYRMSRLGLNIATYAAAFALYATIYGPQQRSLLSASAVMLVTFPLALELLRSTEEQLESMWLYAAIIALLEGELAWGIIRWGLGGLAGGGLLLVAFYTTTGVTQQYMAGRLNRRVVMEFLTIGLVGLAMIVLSIPWLAAR